MAVRFRIGTFQFNTTKQDSLGSSEPVTSIEKEVDDLNDKLESLISNSVKNDTFFNFLRGTAARVILTIVTWLTLFGFGYLAFVNEQLVWWYVPALAILLALHAVSVRYVFSSSTDDWFQFRFLSAEPDSFFDEYQRARRDRAFRVAYRNIANLGFAIPVLYLVYTVLQLDDASSWQIPSSINLSFELSISQVVVLSAGLIALFSLQKYLGWGFKGEPREAKQNTTESQIG
jgi:hypothetical protein